MAGKNEDAKPETSSVTAAKIALAGVIITAVVGTLGTAVVSNWDKIFGPKHSTSTVTPSQLSTGTQSPNISAARDVTIQYGTAADKKTISKVEGKWRTEVFTNAYNNKERSRLVLEIIQQEDTLSGTVTESNPDGRQAVSSVIVDGKITGNLISFYTRGEVYTGDPHPPGSPYKESYFGTLNNSGDEIAFKRFDDLIGGGEQETFIAKRSQ